MIEGTFGNKGELYFEIELIAADGSSITVNALLDTGIAIDKAVKASIVRGG